MSPSIPRTRGAGRKRVSIDDRVTVLWKTLDGNGPGGLIVVSWRKLGPKMRQPRKDTGPDSVGEWFQWIAEQAERRVAGPSEGPAYDA